MSSAVFSTPPRPPPGSAGSTPMGLPASPFHSGSPYGYRLIHPSTRNSADTAMGRRRKRIFESVFPPSPAAAAGTPTPLATPIGSFVDTTAAGSQGSAGNAGSAGVRDQNWDLTWHIVTSFLRFPEEITATSRAGSGQWKAHRDAYIAHKEEELKRSKGIEDAISALLSLESERQDVAVGVPSGGEHGEVPSLIEWYTWEVKRHYLAFVKPDVVQALFERDGVDVCGHNAQVELEIQEKRRERLIGILERLRNAWEIYVGVARKWVFPKHAAVPVTTPRTRKTPGRKQALFAYTPTTQRKAKIAEITEPQEVEDSDDDDDFNDDYDDDDPRLVKFIRALNAIVSYSLPDPQWSELVYDVFLEWCGVILNSPPGMADDEGEQDEREAGERQGSMQESKQKDEEDENRLGVPRGTLRHQSYTPSPSPTPRTGIARTKKQIMAQAELLSAWSHLQTLNLGGGGRRGERVFAEVISVLVTRYIEGMYAGHWAAEDEEGNARDVTAEIGTWVEREVGSLVRLVLVGEGEMSKGRKGHGKKGNARKGKKGRNNKKKKANERVLSPRASFRASELGIGGGSVRLRGGPRMSIDGVLMGSLTGTPSVSRRSGLSAIVPGEGGMEVEGEEDSTPPGEEVEDDIEDVVLRKEDIEGWKKMALGRLGRLRVRELFEIVIDWPDSLGGVMDLRAYITTPQTRMHLSTTFTTAINTRILHPAASTTNILRVYISLIRAFAVLDPRGVLLDRVTRGIRRYLREREDTVRVIVKGLMGGNTPVAGKREDEEQASGTGQLLNPNNRVEEDDLSDLAEELMKGNVAGGAAGGAAAAAAAVAGGGADDLDFDDMSWVPDPIDAGPEYRRIKGTDVVGSLISLYESKEVFVKEFQNVLAERLLECRDYDWIDEGVKNYEPEIQTLELLRIRFGEAALQACDVMLRDIQVGARTDANVRADEGFVKAPATKPTPKKRGRKAAAEKVEKVEKAEEEPEFHAKILSHLFWPTEMKDEIVAGAGSSAAADWGAGGTWGGGGGEKNPLYKLPKNISDLQRRYEKGYEKLNGKRKLEWRDALGYAHVELELEDRIVVVEDAKTWCVAVIEAFGEDGSGDGDKSQGKRVRKSVRELKKELEMDEGLVRRALQFWCAKGVLKEIKSHAGQGGQGSETYMVVERVEEFDDDAEAGSGGVEMEGQQEASDTKAGGVEGGDGDGAGDGGSGSGGGEDPDPPLSAEKQVYAQFIVGMLTNAPGPMVLDRIMMMLGMLVPGGVRCGREEMGELLERLGREGRVERVSGGGGGGEEGWRVKK
ncbi:hypothetical protein BDZ91DRAFT_845934 [Kalaharituber pfeilii]|nr:hypothetical protein BDZ91DRAFT_845934 [Kalaharituber pfeilii]